VADDITRSRAELRELINGFRVTQTLYVLVTSGVADLLAGGPRTAEDLAASIGAHGRALYRLLRALAGLGVLQEDEGHRFELTPLGDGLRTEAPGSLAAWAAYEGSPVNWLTWGNLSESIRTGETGYRLLFDVDAWTYRASHPEEQEAFDRAMVSLTAGASQAVVNAYDFSRFRSVVDIGGGHGGFLGAVLTHSPSVTGVLFDQPHVVAGARDVLREFGVDDRCRVEGGSFFDSIPAEGDAYVLKSVIHDWDDLEAGRILGVCRRCMPAGAVMILIERVLAPPNEGVDDKLSDLNMLVNPGGMERSAEEFEALLRAAGFRLVSITPTESQYKVIEAAPI
ncbi:MAG TPA: methyltransferase, partial [Candidatus Dormibacteraeota bacterium]|nr:methyltransferase [Candidatus Dormibacteraeota bacterium]